MKILEKTLGMFMLLTVAAFCWTVFVHADTWDEITNGGGDAGSFPDAGGTFQMSDGSATFDRITGDNGGSQSGENGFDAYLVTVTDASSFFIFDSSGTISDTKAFIYDMDGVPLMANDDDPNHEGDGDFSFGFGDVDTHPGTVIGAPADLMDGDTIVMVVGSFGDVALGDGGTTVFLPDGGDFVALTGPTGEGHDIFLQDGAGPPGPYDLTLEGAVLAGESKGCEFDLGDVNQDGIVSLLDVSPFTDLLVKGGFQCEADVNVDGVVSLLDVDPFVMILTGG